MVNETREMMEMVISILLSLFPKAKDDLLVTEQIYIIAYIFLQQKPYWELSGVSIFRYLVSDLSISRLAHNMDL